jgi:UDP-N-acetyl-D-mannosaminuronic acid dehydrogenase
MPLTWTGNTVADWRVRKVALLGPGIVGMPMAALLAQARPCIGTATPAEVLVVQRDSPTSGWKVDAINNGRSVIGGVEPGLDDVVRQAVADGLLRATHDPADAADADVVLVCIQTDRDGDGPDYGPLFAGLDGLALALRNRPAGNVPLVVIDSTLAPSSMATVIRERFATHGLVEGRDILLANSPNRVMPGRLVQRIRESDKLVAGLHPATPELVERLYRHIVTGGRLLRTNSLTAEIVKTFENAYRDVRIAFAAELMRYCDARGIDFFALRDQVNQRLEQADNASADAAVVPTGGVLVPTIGVGGHCLPKDGILLWWRYRDLGGNAGASVILGARIVNDGSPAYTADRAELAFGQLANRRVALLGVAYRGDSEDTRNSPTLSLARVLCDRGAAVSLHDPHVRPGDQNLVRSEFDGAFTPDLAAAVANTDLLVLCTPHQAYRRQLPELLRLAGRSAALFDGCNLVPPADRAILGKACTGLGRGQTAPTASLGEDVAAAFRILELGVARELRLLTTALNENYADSSFGRADFQDVRRLAATCTTGCAIADPDTPAPRRPAGGTFTSTMVERARIWIGDDD